MYSYEERIHAVELYIQYDHSLAAVTRELGVFVKLKIQQKAAKNAAICQHLSYS